MYNCCGNMHNHNMMGYDNDNDLEMMYPKICNKVRPMVMRHCDLLERKYGPMCKPSHKELDEICEDMYEKIKNRLDKDDDDDHGHHDNCYRQRRRRYGRRGALNDLFRVLLLGELIGRRRRRRRPSHYGYY